MYVCATYNRYICIRILLFYCNECTLWLSFAQQKAKSKKKKMDRLTTNESSLKTTKALPRLTIPKCIRCT
jgi:hypothetical protein